MERKDSSKDGLTYGQTDARLIALSSRFSSDRQKKGKYDPTALQLEMNSYTC